MNTSVKLPAVSVLMPVFNADKYLSQAIESILKQTIQDIELIIVDDGSEDSSWSIIKKYAESDSRIRCFRQENLRISKTRNRLVELARAEIIAWMDSDDISLPQRLETQANYLSQHPEYVAVGVASEFIDDEGFIISSCKVPCRHEDIDRLHLKGKGGAIIFPSSMIRKQALIDAGKFDNQLTGAEDLNLFLKLAEIGRLANLEPVLFQYRQHTKSISYTASNQIRQDIISVINSAHRRRGIMGKINIEYQGAVPFSVTFNKWAWWAISAGHFPAAKKYTIKAFRSNPFDIGNWKLLLVLSRGLIKKWLD